MVKIKLNKSKQMSNESKMKNYSKNRHAKIKVNKTSTDYQVKDLTSRLKKREDFYRLYLNTKVKFKKFIRKYILH